LPTEFRFDGRRVVRIVPRAFLVTCLALCIWPVRSATANVTTYPDTHKWVDSCSVPTNVVLQNFWSGTPLYNWGMYIGGEEAAVVGCGIWSAAKTNTARSTGWALVPIWDGLQAPCSGNAARMSSNATTAYNQGVTAANNAATAFFARGFLNGQFIYLDIEGFSPGDSTCRNAVKSFVNGWVYQLHVKAVFAGVYGSSCASYPTDWLGIAHPPDSVWLAHYNSVASAWGLACVPNSDWKYDTRHHQYKGGHNETWNGSTLNVDDDCADGYVNKNVADGSAFDPDSGVTEGDPATDEATC
jgi:hypothetical protein